MPTSNQVFITARELRERYGRVSNMFIRRLLKDSSFPRPVPRDQPNATRLWRLAAVEKWERAKGWSPSCTECTEAGR